MDSHEIWREIKWTEGKYSISDKGRVRNANTGIVLRASKTRKGYEKVKLHLMDGKERTITVHRLVAEAFIPNTENKPEVNHKNGIHDDNRVENLEWMTGDENRAHARKAGLVPTANPYKQGYLYRAWSNQLKHNNLCDEWLDIEAFWQWAYKTGYHAGLYLHRIDTQKVASPNNCFWSGTKQYIPNKDIRNYKNVYEYNGIKGTVKYICTTVGVVPETIRYRMKKKGMTLSEAIGASLDTDRKEEKNENK